jgi:hypothetical protein
MDDPESGQFFVVCVAKLPCMKTMCCLLRDF